jgi:nucleoside phosphorylase
MRTKAEVGKRLQLHRGPVASADRDLDFDNVAPLRAAGILVADWESAAIAAVCQFNGVRWAIFRAVSDVPVQADAADYQRQLVDYARNTPAIMERMLHMLPVNISGVRSDKSASARRNAESHPEVLGGRKRRKPRRASG